MVFALRVSAFCENDICADVHVSGYSVCMTAAALLDSRILVFLVAFCNNQNSVTCKEFAMAGA